MHLFYTNVFEEFRCKSL